MLPRFSEPILSNHPHQLGCVWVFHIIYFVFGIKTISAAEVVSA
jgi:hypothetical protein